MKFFCLAIVVPIFWGTIILPDHVEAQHRNDDELEVVGGMYTLTSDRKNEDFLNILTIMGFKAEDIQNYKNQEDSGNIDIHVLEDTKETKKIQMTSYTPNGLQKATMEDNKKPFDDTLWDGRKYKGKISFGSMLVESVTMRKYESLEDVFFCENQYHFWLENLHILYTCSSKAKGSNGILHKASQHFKKERETQTETDDDLL